MPRLEKVMYEKIFNSKILGRNRSIARPLKEDNKQDYYLVDYPILPKFVHRLLNPLYMKLSQLELNYIREDMLQQGISWDYSYESGSDIRRDPFHEHIVR